LEDAAGIAGGDDVCGESGDVVGLASAELCGGFGLYEVVNSGGAAADGGFGNFDEYETGNLGEERARLLGDALRVLEMAGIVEGDARGKRMARGARRKLGQEFGNVAAFCGESFGAVGVDRIVAKKVGVFLHVGAAAGGVDDDGVDLDLFEDVDGGTGEVEGGGFFSGVDAESAAASLFGGSNDFAAFRGENAKGGGVDVREESALDAAEEKTDASAFFALRGSDSRNVFDGLDGREKRVHSGNGFGKKAEEADGAENGLQAGFCVGEQGPAKKLESRGMGEDGEEEMAVEFLRGGARVIACDLRASGFD